MKTQEKQNLWEYNTDGLSGQSRVWIHGLSRALSEAEIDEAKNHLHTFADTWKSHGQDVLGGVMLIENQFIVFCADENESIGGCSIDSSVKCLRELSEQFQNEAVGHDRVFYRENDHIKVLDRNAFRTEVKNGVVKEDTKVFDLTLTKLEDFKQHFEKNFSESWHAKAFPRP